MNNFAMYYAMYYKMFWNIPVAFENGVENQVGSCCDCKCLAIINLQVISTLHAKFRIKKLFL